ncbi:MAG: ribonucleotide reductase subunit alpha [Marinobacter sp.]|uniref:ribonucleotide reductase subunit alpha n=1 Tax=Marinobacter sp. TaxID=50741 RepID=UPI00299EE1BB|nr:ribonucleotide reductase subunit alpha [Marinobacter sp.]MDX1755378.1 ribonucleotide reductase subunit alpha [Marinobacter sp.]
MINSYPDLIHAACHQPLPQRLLFVFCRAELPEDASESERRAFEAGEGGALVPVVCVDKLPQEVVEFDRLREESRHTGQAWDIVFVAAMEGRGGVAPSSDEAQQPLTMMVETLRLGQPGNYLPFDQNGELVSLGP